MAKKNAEVQSAPKKEITGGEFGLKSNGSRPRKGPVPDYKNRLVVGEDGVKRKAPARQPRTRAFDGARLSPELYQKRGGYVDLERQRANERREAAQQSSPQEPATAPKKTKGKKAS